jgi:hypothetical protein
MVTIFRNCFIETDSDRTPFLQIYATDRENHNQATFVGLLKIPILNFIYKLQMQIILNEKNHKRNKFEYLHA